jgi:serine/threonine protein kinase
MADERTIDFDALRRDAAQQGWFLTSTVLGAPSGGGVAYICFKRPLLDSIRDQTVLTSGIGQNKDPLEPAAAMVQHLIHAMAPGSKELGVLKVSKRLDGRMKREIKALSNLTHPSLVPILGSARGEEPDWYIMQFFPRGDLAHRWGDYQGRVIEVLTRTREIAEALVLIHANELIHRDIKPANILLAPDGRWVLADFGIVYEEGATRHTVYGATPMSEGWSPEWVAGRYVDKFDPVVDIHSLARVARAMIAGPDNNPLVSQLDEPDFDLSKLCSGVEHIDDIQKFFVEHITHKAAQSKSQTAQEFIAKINDLLALYTSRRVQQHVFSMVLTHTASWILERTLWQAQNLRLFLPPRVTRFKGSLRLHANGPHDIVNVKVSVREKHHSVEARRQGHERVLSQGIQARRPSISRIIPR